MPTPDAILIHPTEALPVLRIWNPFSEANGVCYEVYSKLFEAQGCGDFSKPSHWQRKLRGGDLDSTVVATREKLFAIITLWLYNLHNAYPACKLTLLFHRRMNLREVDMDRE